MSKQNMSKPKIKNYLGVNISKTQYIDAEQTARALFEKYMFQTASKMSPSTR